MERDVRVGLGAARVLVFGLLRPDRHQVPLDARVVRVQIHAVVYNRQLIFTRLAVPHVHLQTQARRNVFVSGVGYKFV